MTDPEDISCIGCASSATTHVLTKPEPNGDVILHRCHTCGLTFNARWRHLSNAEDYEYYGDRVQWPEERLHDPLNERRYHELLEQLERLTPGRSMLDVGCGAGHLVRVALDRGWDATGIELSPAAVRICERFSLPCRVENLFSPGLDDQRFDLITMIEVIEHVPAPGSFLRRAAQLLTAEGLFYVTTPNFGAFTRRLLRRRWGPISNEHLSYFTPRTLRRLLSAASAFGQVHMDTRNVSVTELRRLLHQAAIPPSDGFQGSPSASADYSARMRMDRSAWLTKVKRAADRVLSVTGTGETITLIARESRPDSEGLHPPAHRGAVEGL